MTARCVMVLGTSSHAGKSWLATALCRWYARQGLRVAPFKAQNMSNNARVVAPAASAGGADADAALGEIGSAQYFQALAARAVPDVRMNPLLLKPERDTASQVVLLGRVDAGLSALPWRERSEHVWPAIAQALDALRAEHDVVVIEGAGSPAEINLMQSDVVNLRVARHADARCLLVADIDRGGAFAHLYGTWALLPEADRARLHGFVLNKFRGDAALLAPAPQMLEQLTGVPTVATLPMWRGHGLPEEDGMTVEGADQASVRGSNCGNSNCSASGKTNSISISGSDGSDCSARSAGGRASPITVAVLAYPRISNLDEFQPLAQVPGVRLRWARSAAQLDALRAGADWIVLPGSKSTAADLAWLRANRLDAAIARHAARGGAVLGICGGLQMLGEALIDPHGIDGNAPGLGLLPLVTVFEREKTLRRRSVRFADELARVGSAWAALAGVRLDGYEIHHGRTVEHPALAAAGQRALPALGSGDEGDSADDALAWRNNQGNVLGLYLHGLFEDARVLQALFGANVATLDSVFDGLADFIELHFQPGVLRALTA